MYLIYLYFVFNLYLSNLVKESKNKHEICVLFIDGDNLKNYNNISYEAGNDVIRSIANIITESIRENDRVYRWLSGDEFIVIMKETNIDNAIKGAERIRFAIEEKTKQFIYPVTISIGISVYPSDAEQIEDIIKNAERANSYAKNTGKNKVVIWTEKYTM